MSPSKRRVVVEQVVTTYGLSQRRACRIIGQSRSSQRYNCTRLPDEDEIVCEIVHLARDYGRYGYRRITAMLRLKGYTINHKRVYRIWRELGLKVPKKQPKRRRLWLNDGSCVRLRAEHRNHVWSYDFVETKTSKGRRLKILNIIDEYTRECLISHAAFCIRSEDVKDILQQIMLRRGTPEYIRSDNGSEFIAKHLRDWFSELSIAPMYITPGSPWDRGAYPQGRTGIARVSTAVWQMNFSTAKSLIIFMRPRLFLVAGLKNTILSGLTALWAIARRLQKPSSSIN